MLDLQPTAPSPVVAGAFFLIYLVLLPSFCSISLPVIRKLPPPLAFLYATMNFLSTYRMICLHRSIAFCLCVSFFFYYLHRPAPSRCSGAIVGQFLRPCFPPVFSSAGGIFNGPPQRQVIGCSYFFFFRVAPD